MLHNFDTNFLVKLAFDCEIEIVRALNVCDNLPETEDKKYIREYVRYLLDIVDTADEFTNEVKTQC